MRVLSSKTFDVTESDDLTTLKDELCGWLPPLSELMGKCITVSIETIGNGRTRKRNAVRQLEELIVDNIVEDDEDNSATWKRFEYKFYFMVRKYFWNDEEIHVTANEALFLYRRLILNDDICKAQTYYLRNMRKRLGKEFLAEAAE
jgi:hypothetical protein